MEEYMFKDLKDFIDDIKKQDREVGSLEETNNKDKETNYLEELGGYPALESDDWYEDKKEEPSDKRHKSFFERLFSSNEYRDKDDEYV